MANKLRFTADPIPEGADMPAEVKVWLQDQMQRISDWWPKDLEDRLAELERLYPYIGGAWTMVDYSSINLGAEGIWEEYQAFEYRIGMIGSNSSQIRAVGECWNDIEPAGNTGLGISGTVSAIYANESTTYLVLVISGDLAWSKTGADGDWTAITRATMGISALHNVYGFWEADDGYYYVAGAKPASPYDLKIVRTADLETGSWSDVFTGSGGTYIPQTYSRGVDSDGKGFVFFPMYSGGYSYLCWSNDYGYTWNKHGTAFSTQSYRRAAWSYCQRSRGEVADDPYIYFTGTRACVWAALKSSIIAGGNMSLRFTTSNTFQNAMALTWKPTTGGVRVVGSETGGTDYSLYSYDGLNFGTGGAITDMGVSSVAWDPDCGWAAASGTKFYTSSDGITFSSISGSGVGSWTSVVGPYSWYKAAS